MVNRLWLLPAAGMTLSWLVPLHILPWVSWHSESAVFAGVLTAATLTLALMVKTDGPGARIPIPAFVIALLAFAAVPVLQGLAGRIEFWGDVWTILLFVALCIASFMLGFQSSSTSEKAYACARFLAGTMLLAGIGCSILALVQSLDVWTTSDWIARTPAFRRPGGNLAQPNQMATVTLMGVVSLLYLRAVDRLSAVVCILAAAILCIGLATTESRTGLLSLAALSVWALLYGRASLRISIGAVLAFSALVYLAYGLWPGAIQHFHDPAGGGPRAVVDTAPGMRLIVWPQLLEAVSDRPWFGWGLRQTSVALTSVVHRYATSEPYTYAHNIVLDLLIGVGAPIAFGLLAAAVSWLWHRRAARTEMLGWYCLALLIPVLVHSMLEFPHAYSYVLAPTMIALGILDARYGKVAAHRAPMYAAAAALALVNALGVMSVIEYVQVEEDFRVARFEAGRIGQTPQEYDRPNISLLTQLDALLHAARIVPARGMTPKDIEVARAGAERFPWPALQNRYALSLALNGRTADAAQVLRGIKVMHGEVLFRDIRLNWRTLASEQYPELNLIPIP